MDAEKFLELSISSSIEKQELPPCIDVRSEGEYKEGSLPGFENAPVLNNEERHLVGTCYKTQGKEEAIRLGYTLVAKNRDEKISRWLSICRQSGKPPIVACWRGGLRSKISCEWLREKGINPVQLKGGYKAVRKILFAETHTVSHEFLVLSGRTGTGKTRLLRELSQKIKTIDLEKRAKHRGSAFGLELNGHQPTQVDFENNLAIDLLCANKEKVLVEDESRVIGSIRLPEKLKTEITESPVVLLTQPLMERSELIFEEYVLSPERNGISFEIVGNHLRTQLARIQRKLGDARYKEVSLLLDAGARASALLPDGKSAHLQWIQRVLEWYYDPMYEYALKKWNRTVIHQGDYESCKKFLLHAFVSPKP